MLRQKSNFTSQFNLIWVVHPLREKYSAFVVGQITFTSSPRPALFKEGRFAIVTNVGCGMRWTLWRRKTGAAQADGEVVWF
jgi:hypothetical protein